MVTKSPFLNDLKEIFSPLLPIYDALYGKITRQLNCAEPHVDVTCISLPEIRSIRPPRSVTRPLAAIFTPMFFGPLTGCASAGASSVVTMGTAALWSVSDVCILPYRPTIDT